MGKGVGVLANGVLQRASAWITTAVKYIDEDYYQCIGGWREKEMPNREANKHYSVDTLLLQHLNPFDFCVCK